MGNYIADTYNSPAYTEEQFRRFEGDSTALSTVGQYFNTGLSVRDVFSYPFYIRLKYKLTTARVRENGAILGAGSIGTSLVSITSTTITHPWGSFSFSSGTSVHTLEIISRTSSTYDIFVDGTHYAEGSITSLPNIGNLLVGGAYYSARVIGYRANVDIYELVIDCSYSHRHYIPCVNGNNVRGFYERLNRGFYQGADNAFSTYGNTQVNTYIPGFFHGRNGLGRLSTSIVLPGTSTVKQTNSAWESSSTGITVKVPLGKTDGSGPMSIFEYIKNATNVSVTSYSASQPGPAIYIPGFGYWATSPYSEQVLDPFTQETFTAWFLDVILNKYSGTSVPANTIEVTVNWSYEAPTTVYNADDFIYIGQGEELFNPVKIPNISLEKNLYYSMVIDNTSSPPQGIVKVYNPTNMWLDFYLTAYVDDSDQTTWQNESRIILEPGKWEELAVESENDYDITYGAAEVDFDSLETNNKFKDVNFEFYGA